MAFALTYHALEVVLTRDVFICHMNKNLSILKGEYGLTRVLLEKQLNFDTLLAKYGSLNWLDKKNWRCNRNTHPTRLNTYVTPNDNLISVHPLETVFYKPLWIEDGIILSEQYLNETIAYMDWALARKKLSSRSKF
jgi:hypothetical protein